MENKELIEQARQTLLVDYLGRQGIILVKDGIGRYRHPEHDSLVFTKNAFYWNSKQLKGNALDYVMQVEGLGFQEAVEVLTGQKVPTGGNKAESGSKVDLKRSIAYLCKSRGISYETVQLFLKAGKLEEGEYHNLVFPIFDETGKCVGSELHGTNSDKPFKGFSKGSARGYGFNVTFGDCQGKYDYILFFESAIDLMSYVDLQVTQRRKSLKGCLLVSMGGLKSEVVETCLLVFNCSKGIVLCVDNDAAGDEFIAAVKNDYEECKENRPDKKYKDWNDELRGILIS